jgi:ankyrin repeat protein
MTGGGCSGIEVAMELRSAAGSGDVAEVRRLAALGADVNMEDYNRARPLHYAACNGHVEVLRTLVELGADVHAVTITETLRSM